MTYTVSQLARAAGVSPHTVRYYVARGLLRVEKDPRSGYHRFAERDLRALAFARRAQGLGFTLRAEFVRLSRATMRKIKQNLFWAFAYNAIGNPGRRVRLPQPDPRRRGDGAELALGGRQLGAAQANEAGRPMSGRPYVFQLPARQSGGRSHRLFNERSSTMKKLLIAALTGLVLAIPLAGFAGPDMTQTQITKQVQEAKKKLAAAQAATGAERQKLMQEHMQLMQTMMTQMRAAKPGAGMTPQQMREWIDEHMKLMDQMMGQMMDEHHMMMQGMGK